MAGRGGVVWVWNKMQIPPRPWEPSSCAPGWTHVGGPGLSLDQSLGRGVISKKGKWRTLRLRGLFSPRPNTPWFRFKISPTASSDHDYCLPRSSMWLASLNGTSADTHQTIISVCCCCLWIIRIIIVRYDLYKNTKKAVSGDLTAPDCIFICVHIQTRSQPICSSLV